MSLNPLDTVNGIFSLIFVAISLFVGVIILSKYFRYKERIYLMVGATWIFISCPWWSSSLSFLVALSNGVGITPEAYFTIGNILIPCAIILWLLAFTEFLYTEKRKLILLVFALYGSIFEILFFAFLFINPNLIGDLNPPVDVRYNSFIMIFLISFLAIVVITGFLFANLSLKSKDPEVKIKGKLLVIAYITFSFGAVLDSAIPLNEVTIIITRLILIISAICWYGGFLLPKWMKKYLLRSK
ncbi:MAG: hypothetical protein HWN81_05535 [Candidatus Lokiarchaeota archaeon]|nr:hypothetical protein [Candidatus Lokiarchaeota archaeon]